MAGKITIADIARESGVSITSVSFALNGQPGVSEATREQVRSVARRLGWTPSMRGRRLAGRRADAVGLILERGPEVLGADPFFSTFIAGVEAELEPRELALELHVSPDRESAIRRYRRLADDGRVDGVLLTDIGVQDHRVSLVRELGLPAVAVLDVPMAFDLPAVFEDHRPGIAQTVRHLAAQGHRRIGYLTGPPARIHAAQRQQAWQDSMIECELAPGPVEHADFTADGGAAATERLLGHTPRPTAIVCANDLMAIGVLRRLRELGIDVPDEMSVAGYDGIEISRHVTPSLTTVITDPQTVGRRAAQLLLELIAKRDPTDIEIEPAKLAVRNSTGRAPA